MLQVSILKRGIALAIPSCDGQNLVANQTRPTELADRGISSLFPNPYSLFPNPCFTAAAVAAAA